MSVRVRIWSNGTEYQMWESINCDRCVKAWTPDWVSTCDLNDAIAFACVDDGTLAPEIAVRLGYTDVPLFLCKERQTEGTAEPKPAAREMQDAGAQPLPGFTP